MNDNLSTVGMIYEAFGRGDIATVLSHISDDVRWEEWADHSGQKAGVRYLEARQGKAGATAFFQVLGQYKFHEFRVLSLMAGGNQVAAELSTESELPGGPRVRDELIHLWTFDDRGEVVRFRHYLDTAKHIEAARAAVAV